MVERGINFKIYGAYSYNHRGTVAFSYPHFISSAEISTCRNGLFYHFKFIFSFCWHVNQWPPDVWNDDQLQNPKSKMYWTPAQGRPTHFPGRTPGSRASPALTHRLPLTRQDFTSLVLTLMISRKDNRHACHIAWYSQRTHPIMRGCRTEPGKHGQEEPLPKGLKEIKSKNGYLTWESGSRGTSERKLGGHGAFKGWKSYKFSRNLLK